MPKSGTWHRIRARSNSPNPIGGPKARFDGVVKIGPSTMKSAPSVSARAASSAECADAPIKRSGPSNRRAAAGRSEEHTSELQSRLHLVCRLLLEKKKKQAQNNM